MSGFCPHDWHGTNEADLQQMSWGEDYWIYADATQFTAAYRAARKAEYAIHDEAIAQAKREGLTFHLLPAAEQNTRLDAAEAALAGCQICDGEGRIWNNADPTSGQFVECGCQTLSSGALGSIHTLGEG